ncbi:unnamed protein product, partial [Discosporangium mesarthrocarpum]
MDATFQGLGGIPRASTLEQASKQPRTAQQVSWNSNGQQNIARPMAPPERGWSDPSGILLPQASVSSPQVPSISSGIPVAPQLGFRAQYAGVIQPQQFSQQGAVPNFTNTTGVVGIVDHGRAQLSGVPSHGLGVSSQGQGSYPPQKIPAYTQAQGNEIGNGVHSVQALHQYNVSQHMCGAAWSPSADQLPIYEAMLDVASAQSAAPGTVSGRAAVEFFRRSGLPKDDLKKIWTMCDPSHAGYLTRPSFFGFCLPGSGAGDGVGERWVGVLGQQGQGAASPGSLSLAFPGMVGVESVSSGAMHTHRS